jgi:hypothetical protein
LNHRKDFVLFKRGVTRGGSVWYYSTYDSYGRRTAARSTGQTNKTLAERYCNGLMRVLHVKGSKRYRKKDRTIFVRHDLMVRIHREFKGGEYLFGWAKQAKATTLPVVRSQVVELPRFSGQVRACVLGNTQMARFILDWGLKVQGRVTAA